MRKSSLLETAAFLRHEQHFHEGHLEQLLVPVAEGADGVVVGIHSRRVGRQEQSGCRGRGS